jgi:proteasome lid subunit RPN8/RPN11
MRRGAYLTPDLKIAIQRHAMAAYPYEALGVITPAGYREMENLSDTPEHRGKYDARAMQALQISGDLCALVHSHPNGPNAPSGEDAALQARVNVPGVLVVTNGDGCMEPTVWGDMFEPDPLEGRGFQHYIHDCFELGRDYYWFETGKRPPPFPRGWAWWQDGSDMVDTHFRKAGFLRLDDAEVQAGGLRTGDAIVVATGQNMKEPRQQVAPNHVMIYLGDGKVLNHSSSRLPYDPSRLSRVETLSRWLPYVQRWLRPDENNQTLWRACGEVRGGA